MRKTFQIDDHLTMHGYHAIMREKITMMEMTPMVDRLGVELMMKLVCKRERLQGAHDGNENDDIHQQGFIWNFECL